MATHDEARVTMKDAAYTCRAALRELEGARGGEVYGATADIIDAALALVRAVRAYLDVTKKDGV